MSRRLTAIAGLALLWPLAGAAAAQGLPGASFTGVGDLAGGAFLSRVHGISGDGRVAVGESEIAGGRTEGFRFEDGVMTPLGTQVTYWNGDLSMGTFHWFTTDETRAFATTHDGFFVVGQACGEQTCIPVRWGYAAVPLEPEVDGSEILVWGPGQATDVAGVGTDWTAVVSVGDYDYVEPALLHILHRAFRHQGPILDDASFVNFAATSFGGSGTYAAYSSISPDAGSIAFTASFLDAGALVYGAFVDRPGEPQTLLASDDALTVSARDVGPGGHVVVGRESLVAARWVDGTLEPLGDLPGGTSESEALAVSNSGDVVVGWGTTASGREAFVWRSAVGMQRLADVLTAAGVDLTGWTLTDATGVSASGLVVVGFGENPDGYTEGFVATLPSATGVPLFGTPATLALLVLLSAAGIAATRRSHGRARIG